MPLRLRLFVVLLISLVVVSFGLIVRQKGVWSRQLSQLFSPPSSKPPSLDNLTYLSPNVLGEKTGSVLAAATDKDRDSVSFNLAALFNENVSMLKNLEVAGDVSVQGNLIAANLLTGLNAGSGISLSGSAQKPVINNTGVLSFQGQTGAIALTEGSGIDIDGLTIKNTDPGSAQNIFKTIKIGNESFTAGSNADTLTFSAGEGVTLTVDKDKKTITMANSGAAGSQSWTTSENTVSTTNTQAHVSIGTNDPGDYSLYVNGAAYVAQQGDAPGEVLTAGRQVQTGAGLSGGGALTSDLTISITAPVCTGNSKLQWTGTAFICTEDSTGSSLSVVATRSGTLASFSYDGTQILGINTNGDITIGGKITMKEDDTNLANGNDVFVYETSKDFDGGAWTNSDKIQGSSWYNETIDHTSTECDLGNDDRCGRRAFPKRAIIVATNNNLLIFDAQENSLWMKINKGEGYAVDKTESNFTSVHARDGIIYAGTSQNGLLAFNFVEDKIYRYDYNHDNGGRAVFLGNIADRNTNRGYGARASWGKIASDKVLGVYTQVINNKTYIAVATLGGVSVINPAEQRVVRYIDGHQSQYAKIKSQNQN